jgi:PhnB protein
MRVHAYLNFNGRAEEAIDFYCRAIGAERTGLTRFREGPDPSAVRPGIEDKVMHSQFRVGETIIMASDGRCLESDSVSFSGVILTILEDDIGTAERHFAALSDGGRVQAPLMETFFAESFGMVDDRFGLSWMVLVPKDRS